MLERLKNVAIIYMMTMKERCDLKLHEKEMWPIVEDHPNDQQYDLLLFIDLPLLIL